MDIAGPAAGDRRRGHTACGRRRTESAADTRRTSALFLRHRDGLSWRAGAHAAGREISHRLLRGAVVRRHGRRAVRRPDRAVCVLVGRRIPDPVGAGGVVPAGAWRRTAAALEPVVLAFPGGTRGDPDRVFLFHWQALVVAGRPSGL